MSDMYAIKTSTLTAIGDAVRSKTNKFINTTEKAIEPDFIITGNTAEFSQDNYDYASNSWRVYRFPIDLTGLLGDKYSLTKKLYVEYSFISNDGSKIPIDMKLDFNGTLGGGTEKLFYSIDFNNINGSGSLTTSNTISYAYGVDLLVSRYLDGETNTYYEYSFEIKFWACNSKGEFIELNTMTPLEMAETINGLFVPNIEPIVLTGDCTYACAGNIASNYIKNFGNTITTNDITSTNNMFYYYKNETVPFDINLKSGTNASLTYMFAWSNIEESPKINNTKPSDTSNIFFHCYYLRDIPDDIDATWDWSYIDTATSTYSGNRNNTFNTCYSLRKVPMSFLNHGNPVVTTSYCIYNSLFKDCASLDEVIGLPLPHLNVTWTSNAFNSTFDKCYRLKEMTFAVQEDGTPYSVNWKSQTIDLSSYIGYVQSSYYEKYITDYNSGITKDKKVTSANYNELKNDEDWYTLDVMYSRYNRASAANTINSLPDASAYLAANGGTNTIKFKGSSGSLTDGLGISGLPEEVIAVAAAKGWTVSLV